MYIVLLLFFYWNDAKTTLFSTQFCRMTSGVVLLDMMNPLALEGKRRMFDTLDYGKIKNGDARKLGNYPILSVLPESLYVPLLPAA
jgi:hypothetical protein